MLQFQATSKTLTRPLQPKVPCSMQAGAVVRPGIRHDRCRRLFQPTNLGTANLAPSACSAALTPSAMAAVNGSQPSARETLTSPELDAVTQEDELEHLLATESESDSLLLSEEDEVDEVRINGVSASTTAPPSPSIASVASLPLPGKPLTLVVFSGGTAFNSVAGALRQLTTHVTHVLPVSDDGGSTAEIVRVIGGPAVGDIRSRCVRLADDSDAEARAVKTLLAHRLAAYDATAAKQEWYNIVEGEHPLWGGVSDAYKHMIRAFLVHFHTHILSSSTERFNFANGSVGNFFFAGARVFFRSLEAAIFLFNRVTRLPEGSHVLPAICTDERITLGAELEDGTFIRGQNAISHPSPTGNGLQVDKSETAPLPSPIRRVFYLSSEGIGQEHEVFPHANPRVLQQVERADAVIYGMGSLYTSICPTLCLNDMGEAIARRKVPKILLLNGSHDRETSSSGAHDGPMTAADMVQALSDALNRRRNRKGHRLRFRPAAYVTGLLLPRGGPIPVDHSALALLGVKHVLEVDSLLDQGKVVFNPLSLVQQIDVMIKLHAG